MGAKQSSPSANPAANGRTRAYSGSDLPSSTSSSSGSNVSRTTAGGVRYHASGASSSQHLGARARSVGGSGGSGARPQSGINIPNSSGAYSSQESGGSSPEEADRGHDGPRLLIGSLPAHLSPHLFGGFKCPVCSKFVSSDEMDLHLVLCLTKPRVTYNEDVLTKDAGECAICLEELVQGDTIARLPCLCLYHKGCIDEWFEVNRSCPEHPSD
ncbi:E3 ubiquitin-protein ligase znrf2 isoform X1 [Centropristis striata]|uniref:E3 ubiquitin-protein ligase znrf2 isoform X1 n=1 Tax=Centropristis striata TaxID=184440 RepID=UPI0027E05802|nr:E3 ubiquitin-protein ligase znrf2 isoform X1 [Centropristis striata]